MSGVPIIAIHCFLAGLDNNAEWAPGENDVFLKKTHDKNLLDTLMYSLAMGQLM